MWPSSNLSATATPPARVARTALAFLAWTVVFGLAYTQAPLYYSNQTQYFLHGLAHSGAFPDLGHDWLANTADPTPVFSTFVEWTYRLLPEEVFYVCYLLLQGVYFWSLLGLFEFLAGSWTNRTARWCFAALVVAAHAALLRLASARWLGVDYPWFLQVGVAGQYVLGFGLQPSVAGVFLIVSIVAALRGQMFAAATWACLGAVLHGTYLLGAALLVIAYMGLRWREAGWLPALLLGAWALLCVLPVVVYNAVCFAPSSAAAFAEAQRLLAHVRIPHHAEPQKWCDTVALLQVAWMGVALWLVRGTRLFPIFLTVASGSVLLTLVQLATNSDTLALLFPWRTSAFLMPIATAVILAKLVLGLRPWLDRRGVQQSNVLRAGCVTVIGIMAVSGAAIMAFGWGYATNTDELPMLDSVRATRQDGDVYLVPVSLPKLGAGKRGVTSTNFTPAPRSDKDKNLIPIDLQRFRLYTGAAIFVDFKSIPYQDVEVLEWYRRMVWTQEFYAAPHWNRRWLGAATAEGITHIVAPRTRAAESGRLELVSEDAFYRVYRIHAFRKPVAA
jgi:hypothetical protein